MSNNHMLEIFHYGFMINAFLAGGMIAVTAPLIGHFLVMRRFSLIADTLSHVALAGVAIGLLTGTQPLLTTLIVTVLSALVIEKLRSTQRISGETVLAMFLPGGLALAIVLLSFSNGLNANLFSYLFGSIMTVEPDELWLMLCVTVIAVSTVMMLYNKLLYAAFDEESAQVSGVSVQWVNRCLLVLTAMIVSLAMRAVGVLLVGALMTIPVVTAMQVARSFRSSILWSICFAALCVVGGLFSAYYLNLPASGAIVLLSLGVFGVASTMKRW